MWYQESICPLRVERHPVTIKQLRYDPKTMSTLGERLSESLRRKDQACLLVVVCVCVGFFPKRMNGLIKKLKCWTI